MLDFVLVGGHLVDGGTRNQHDLGAFARGDGGHVGSHVAGNHCLGTFILRTGFGHVAQAAGNGCDVDRGIAAADDDDAVADVLQAAFVEGAQERDGGHAVGRFGAGNGQRPAGLGAHRHEDGVVVLVEFVKADVAADAALETGFNTHFDDAVDFRVQHFARGTEARDAVAHHAAELFVLVEDGDAMAAQTQLVGGGQTGRARADDGNLLAGFGCCGREFHVVGNPPVAHEMLDRVDADMVFDHVAVAAGLTGRGTDAAHDAGEGVGFGDAAEGVFLPGGPSGRLLDAAHDVQIATDVFAGRAGPLAGRRGEHVLRTLVRPARLEDAILGRTVVLIRLAVFVATPCQAFGFCALVCRDSHVDSPNAYKTFKDEGNAISRPASAHPA